MLWIRNKLKPTGGVMSVISDQNWLDAEAQRVKALGLYRQQQINAHQHGDESSNQFYFHRVILGVGSRKQTVNRRSVAVTRTLHCGAFKRWRPTRNSDHLQPIFLPLRFTTMHQNRDGRVLLSPTATPLWSAPPVTMWATPRLQRRRYRAFPYGPLCLRPRLCRLPV